VLIKKAYTIVMKYLGGWVGRMDGKIAGRTGWLGKPFRLKLRPEKQGELASGGTQSSTAMI
jgi:hypothetical protein